MLPKVVLHKRNGHRHPPEKTLSPGEIMRLVHSDRERSLAPTYDLLKFAQITQSEKPSALSEQAAREIDAIKSPLADVLAQTQAAFARGELGDVQVALQALKTQAELAAHMTTRLAASARARGSEHRFSPERRLVNLNELAAQTLDLLAPRLGETITAGSRLDPGIPAIVGNARQLQQALVALITYSGQAMTAAGKPGTITIETSHGEGVLKGEGIVRVRIMDEGPGIPQGILPGIFQPFSTPESVGEGMDADLSIASKIIKEHGGVVSAENLPGGGASFILEIPAV